MKHLLIATAFATALAVAPAQAAPVIAFDIAGAPASSVDVDVSPTGCFRCRATATLDAGLDGRTFELGVGESETFDFFRVTVGGLGSATIDVAATLGFDAPAGEAVTGEGSGFFATFFGALTAGGLFWDDIPAITLADGSIFSIDFSDIISFGVGNSATVTATVTALAVADEDGVPVPEPGVLGLLGLGLLGVGLRRRLA